MATNYSGEPCTYEDYENPFLMDHKDDSNVIEWNGNKLTASYLWTLDKEKRKECLNYVFKYYRDKGFPNENISDYEFAKEYQKLVSFKTDKVIFDKEERILSNSGNVGISICRSICSDMFYAGKSGERGKSVMEVFNDDEQFIKVLKNRMGWNLTKEDGGKLRPYMFPISDKQIRTGIINSGLGDPMSNFRPSIAKWMYEHAISLLEYNTEDNVHIIDYSAGWGARALGALSLDASSLDYNISYTGFDPHTYSKVNDIIKKIGKGYNSVCYGEGSDSEYFKNMTCKADVIGSCPPYFNQEKYSDDITQCYNMHKDYNEWLNEYWRKTILNCDDKLKLQGIFILVIKESYDKYDLMKDMTDVIYKNTEWTLVEDWRYKTSRNHLTGKAKNGKVVKTNEHVLFFKKV